MKPLHTEGSCKQSLITGNIFQNRHFVLPEDGTLAQQHVEDNAANIHIQFILCIWLAK
jgi:hypothetical protein